MSSYHDLLSNTKNVNGFDRDHCIDLIMYVLSSSFNCKIGFSVFKECNRIVPSSQLTYNNEKL